MLAPQCPFFSYCSSRYRYLCSRLCDSTNALTQKQNTRLNSKIAEELRDEIFDLINSIGEVVVQMNNAVKPQIQSLNDGQKSYIRDAQVKKPSLFKEVVDKLIEYVVRCQDDRFRCG